MTNHQLFLENTAPIDELQFGHVDEKYRSVLTASVILTYIALAGLALLLLLLDNRVWCPVAECVIVVAFAINISIISKACRFKGYALRENDITFRSGVLFPKTTTVPYNRVQQVSVSQNPVSKYFGLYSVDIVNGAQSMSSLTIPGLNEETANQIKNHIIKKLRHAND